MSLERIGEIEARKEHGIEIETNAADSKKQPKKPAQIYFLVEGI